LDREILKVNQDTNSAGDIERIQSKGGSALASANAKVQNALDVYEITYLREHKSAKERYNPISIELASSTKSKMTRHSGALPTTRDSACLLRVRRSQR
jgi:hypothetical protein